MENRTLPIMETVSAHVIRIPFKTHTLPPLDTTNTYVIHSGSDAVIVDCGSNEPEVVVEMCKRLKARGIERVVAYALTHYHADHSQGIPFLQATFPAPVYVHPLDQANASRELNCSVEDLIHTNEIHLQDVRICFSHQPGHTHGHVHIQIEPDQVLVVGDHMAGVGTVWIGPPDGHMSDYFSALTQIAESGTKMALPGHGPVISDPKSASENLLKHRRDREEQILNLLKEHPQTVNDLVEQIYAGRNLGKAVWVAKRTTQAHLSRLMDLGLVTCFAPAPDFKMLYALNV